MKKGALSFFANVFGAKSASSSGKTSVRITSYSQPHVLATECRKKK